MESRLHKFATLVESGSFSRAAIQLHISQPALSIAIHKLERELQAQLLIPGSRPLALTDAGRHAYQTAKELRISTGNLQTRLAELAKAQLTIRIGLIDSVATSLFSQISDLGTVADNITLSIMVDNSRVLRTAVEQDAIDLAFVAGELQSNPHLSVQSLGSEPLVLVCSSLIASSVEASLIAGQLPNFISYDQRSNTFHLVQKALHRQNITAQTSVYSTSPEVALHLIHRQRGTAVLPFQAIESLIVAGELTLVGTDSIGSIPRPISMIRRRDKQLPKLASHFTRQVQRALVASNRTVDETLKTMRR
jgi:DNA-binding transcriptional LysR family regulator